MTARPASSNRFTNVASSIAAILTRNVRTSGSSIIPSNCSPANSTRTLTRTGVLPQHINVAGVLNHRRSSPARNNPYGKPLALLAGILLILSTACGGGDDEVETLPLGPWAARFCAAGEQVGSSLTTGNQTLEAEFGADVTALSLEERKERVSRRSEWLIPAVEAHLSELQAFQGPEDTRKYQEAVEDYWAAFLDADQAGSTAVAKAADAADIEAVNADQGATLAELIEESNEQFGKLSPETRAALGSVSKCGGL